MAEEILHSWEHIDELIDDLANIGMTADKFRSLLDVSPHRLSVMHSRLVDAENKEIAFPIQLIADTHFADSTEEASQYLGTFREFNDFRSR